MEAFRILNAQFTAFSQELVALLPNFLAAALVLALTFVVARLAGHIARKILTRSKTRPSLLRAVRTVLRVLVWVAGTLIAATIIFPNLTPTKLVAGLGIGSIAIGLAFKDIFENFLAGFLILLRKPMRIGDDIECEGLSGKVEEISIRDTFLRQRSGELVIVPNSFLFKNPVKILTDRELRRLSIVVGVAYGADASTAKKVIETAIQTINCPEADQPAQVFAAEFNTSSIDFLVRWWAKSAPPDEHASRNKAVLAIKAALDAAGIEIPFPYRTLTFAEPLKLRDATDGPPVPSDEF